jgi:hypothetical protein
MKRLQERSGAQQWVIRHLLVHKGEGGTQVGEICTRGKATKAIRSPATGKGSSVIGRVEDAIVVRQVYNSVQGRLDWGK